MKSEMLRTRFDDQSDLDALTSAYFDLKSIEWYKRSITMYKDQLNRVILSRGAHLS